MMLPEVVVANIAFDDFPRRAMAMIGVGVQAERLARIVVPLNDHFVLESSAPRADCQPAGAREKLNRPHPCSFRAVVPLPPARNDSGRRRKSSIPRVSRQLSR